MKEYYRWRTREYNCKGEMNDFGFGDGSPLEGGRQLQYSYDYTSQSNEKRITVDAAQTGLKVKNWIFFCVLNGRRDFFRSREK